MHEGSDSAHVVVNPPHLDAYGHLMRRRNRHCIITIGAAPHPRKFYWRYKAGLQRAVRDGDWKYLRIAGNEFLFGVVQDPRERANLKDRHRDVFDRLKNDWEAWNAQCFRNGPVRQTTANPEIYWPIITA